MKNHCTGLIVALLLFSALSSFAQTEPLYWVIKTIDGTKTAFALGDIEEMYCTSEREDNHEYVDLGLPSGTLWATCNLGAFREEEYGGYFAWGETEERSTPCEWSNYKWMTSEQSTEYYINKYQIADKQTSGCWYKSDTFVGDGKSALDYADDAASVLWGSNWCMPTAAQLTELVNKNYTKTSWTTSNGVYGRLITSKTNGNTLFLPAAGYESAGHKYYLGSSGYYWSRELSKTTIASYLSFGSSEYLIIMTIPRIRALPIRPVRR